MRPPDIGGAAVARREARQPESENQFEEAGRKHPDTATKNTHTDFHHLVFLSRSKVWQNIPSTKILVKAKSGTVLDRAKPVLKNSMANIPSEIYYTRKANPGQTPKLNQT